MPQLHGSIELVGDQVFSADCVARYGEKPVLLSLHGGTGRAIVCSAQAYRCLDSEVK